MSTPQSTDAASILIAEDDASLRRLLEMRLTLDGYRARGVADGAAALELLQSWLPDAIVTDVMMPRLSGLSLCRSVRADARTAAIPIIVLTACCLDDDIQSVIDLGAVTFMNKPFDAVALGGALRSALATGSAATGRAGGDRPG